MRITGLSSQLRDPNRINVSIDGKYRFSLDIAQVVDLGIRKGQEITSDELANLEAEGTFGKLYARALEFCLVRPRSVREVREYLYRKQQSTKYRARSGEVRERQGVAPEVANRVLDRLQQKGHVDDEKFTRYFVESRNQRRGSSMRRLRQELTAKGVASDIAETILGESSRNDGDELAKVIVKKRQRYPDEQKLIAYLMRQGFLYDDIKLALVEAVE